jgi:hypothetical protein
MAEMFPRTELNHKVSVLITPYWSPHCRCRMWRADRVPCVEATSVPMIMRHLSPKSLASGRRTEITWLCQSETGSWMAPLGLTRWEAGGRPPWQPQRRRFPCRIGRAVGRSPGETS